MQFYVSKLLILTYILVLAGCASSGPSKVDTPGSKSASSTDISAFEDFESQITSIGREFFREGHFINVDDIKQVTTSLSQDEVSKLIGEPDLVRESDKKWWFYNINLPLINQKDYIVCQYRVTFDEAGLVSQTLWRRSFCQARYSSLITPEPLVAQTTPVKDVSLSSDVLFEFDSADLTQAGIGELDKFINTISPQLDQVSLFVIGHTDRIGSETYNCKLSQLRADAVSEYFQSQGLAANNIITVGRGSRSPTVQCEGNIVNKELKACLAPDRRVQIIIQGGI